MNKSTRVIQVVEMTREEADYLWHNPDFRKQYGVLRLLTDDGQNEVLFEGEDFYRPIVYID